MKLKLIIFLILTSTFILDSYAGSATWNFDPVNGDWNASTNWTPNTVPDGRSDIATFNASNVNTLRFSADTELAEIVFNPSASGYTITTAFVLNLGGAGIVDNSGIQQNFVISADSGKIHFRNSATAGDAHFGVRAGRGQTTELSFYDTATAGEATIDNHGGNLPGATLFFDSSTAGNATIYINAGNPNGGACVFMGTARAGTATFFCQGEGPGNAGVQLRAHSSADHGAFIIEGGPPHEAGQYIDFLDHSRGARSIVTANGGDGSAAPGGTIYFGDNSNAENATLVANRGFNGGQSGLIVFDLQSRGDRARVELNRGILAIDSHTAPGLNLGSIEGDGRITLGANNLTCGENNLDTTFFGTIEDGSLAGGSLTKVGTGILALTGENTFTGGTVVSGGVLSVGNIDGSATGPGSVSVQAGGLVGDGTVAGPVTIGTGGGVTSTLAPGRNSIIPGTLIAQNGVTLNSDGVYQFNIQSNSGTASTLNTNGITIDGDSFFVSKDSGDALLPPGTSFEVIANAASTPINGTFANVPDGATISVGNNRFQANYEGGDGNDLTLTVVP